MSREDDRIGADVACLRGSEVPFTLVSTAGFHCDVYRSAGAIVRNGRRDRVDFVVKVSKQSYRVAEVAALAREHRRIRAGLEEIVPPALFVSTRIDGEPGAIVLVGNCTPWFDLSNAGNEEEALPLLRRKHKARDQLRRFTTRARRWLDEDACMIDLGGTENLVLDRHYDVRYLDSFNVFFYTDLGHVIDVVDREMQARIELSVERLEYLERLLQALR